MDQPKVALALADQPWRAALADRLKAAGYEVQYEVDPAPDFALLELPLADAVQAAALRTAGTAFAVLAAPEHAAHLRHAVDAGAHGCFVKPIDASVIVPSVGAWIARAGELRALRREQQAFDALRRQARDQRAALAMLARAIVDGTDALRQTPE